MLSSPTFLTVPAGRPPRVLLSARFLQSDILPGQQQEISRRRFSALPAVFALSLSAFCCSAAFAQQNASPIAYSLSRPIPAAPQTQTLAPPSQLKAIDFALGQMPADFGFEDKVFSLSLTAKKNTSSSADALAQHAQATQAQEQTRETADLAAARPYANIVYAAPPFAVDVSSGSVIAPAPVRALNPDYERAPATPADIERGKNLAMKDNVEIDARSTLIADSQNTAPAIVAAVAACRSVESSMAIMGFEGARCFATGKALHVQTAHLPDAYSETQEDLTRFQARAFIAAGFALASLPRSPVRSIVAGDHEGEYCSGTPAFSAMQAAGQLAGFVQTAAPDESFLTASPVLRSAFLSLNKSTSAVLCLPAPGDPVKTTALNSFSAPTPLKAQRKPINR